MDNITASPLSWPMTKERTPAHKRTRSRFSMHEGSAPTISWTRHQLKHELRRMGVTDYVLSTNLDLRLDGEPRSGQKEPEDPGVAVYFKVEGRPTVLACDCWDRVADNLRAIVKHIDALRGMDRWGVGTRAQAFAGFAALPPPIHGEPPKRAWRQVFGVASAERVDLGAAMHLYRKLAKERAGDEEALKELNIARDEAKEELS